MGYKSWFDTHAKKHKRIVDKLLKEGRSREEIIEYFLFDNMLKNEPDFCPLYKKNKKCHQIEELNCYLCACPNFRFNDEATIKKSYCSINSKEGRELKTQNGIIHQDCSNCTIPHHKKYIQNNFSISWIEIMKECDLNS